MVRPTSRGTHFPVPGQRNDTFSNRIPSTGRLGSSLLRRVTDGDLTQAERDVVVADPSRACARTTTATTPESPPWHAPAGPGCGCHGACLADNEIAAQLHRTPHGAEPADQDRLTHRLAPSEPAEHSD